MPPNRTIHPHAVTLVPDRQFGRCGIEASSPEQGGKPSKEREDPSHDQDNPGEEHPPGPRFRTYF